MATKKRRGAAKGTYARQEAARKRGAAGKRFVGETAAQSAEARKQERKKVARMARAARRDVRPAEAAMTVGATGAPRPAEQPAPESGEGEAAFRAAEADAALAGAEVEPLERPLASVSHLPPRDAAEKLRQLDAEGAARATAPSSWEEPYADVSAEHAADRGADAAPPLGGVITELVRSALGLVRTLATAPFRLAMALPRLALRAVLHA